MTFSFLLILFLQVETPSDTRINWAFEFPACDACLDSQLTLIHRFGKPSDKILILAKDFKTEQVQSFLHRLPHWINRRQNLERQKLTHPLGLGFEVVDYATEEKVTYRSLSGFYNAGRAAAILVCFRYENTD